jgi:hypothetical protein
MQEKIVWHHSCLIPKSKSVLLIYSQCKKCGGGGKGEKHTPIMPTAENTLSELIVGMKPFMTGTPGGFTRNNSVTKHSAMTVKSDKTKNCRKVPKQKN